MEMDNTYNFNMEENKYSEHQILAHDKLTQLEYWSEYHKSKIMSRINISSSSNNNNINIKMFIRCQCPVISRRPKHVCIDSDSQALTELSYVI